MQPYEWTQNEWIQSMQGQKLPQAVAISLMSVEHASSLQLFAVFEIACKVLHLREAERPPWVLVWVVVAVAAVGPVGGS